MKNVNNLYQREWRSVSSIALIFAFRMLGLFMILPIFAIAADDYTGATPTNIGFAIGVYGLTQALLQLPFGALSDKFGRKPLILFGLVLFALGGVIAAMSHSITGLIIGRAVQGGGAVGSTLLALTADLTKIENRSKAMALIGMTIGASFMISMILGPLLYSQFALSGLFWFTTFLAISGMLILWFIVPKPPKFQKHSDTEPSLSFIINTLKNTQLLKLDVSIFCLHAILTALFVVLPIILEQIIGIHENKQWLLYTPVLIGAFILMLPIMILSEKRHKTREIMLLSILILAGSTFAIYLFHHSALIIGAIMMMFFTAFSLLEATLPSLISKIAPSDSKGTALGIYSTSQFLGIFFGGSTAGILLEQFGIPAVLLFLSALGAGWFVIAFTLPTPPQISSWLLPVGELTDENANQLHQELNKQPGVVEATIIIEECIAYLKVDDTKVDKPQLIQLTKGFML